MVAAGEPGDPVRQSDASCRPTNIGCGLVASISAATAISAAVFKQILLGLIRGDWISLAVEHVVHVRQAR